MKKMLLLFGILVIGSLLFSCVKNEASVEKAEPPALNGQQKVTAKDSREVEWEKVMAESRKEGKLAIHLFSGLTPVREELSKAMSKYGLKIEFTSGRATELAEKIIREHRAGLYIADLYLGGATTAISRVKPSGVLEPIMPHLLLPEVKGPEAWWGGRVPFVDKEGLILALSAYPSSGLVFNADLVSGAELKSYRDLLNPKWKSKIVMSDPTIGGSGSNWFSTVGLSIMGIEYLKELARQNLMFTRDLRLQAEWIARGKYPIGIGLATGNVIEMQNAGAPIVEHTPKEGTYLTSGGGNLALYKNAPHPNARKVFINWMLSKEGLTIFSRAMEVQSARIDVPTDFLPPKGIRQPGMSYVDTSNEEHQLQAAQQQEIAREIFGL